jgi:hypothetical protein
MSEATEIESQARTLEVTSSRAPLACALHEEALAFFGGTPPPGKDIVLLDLGHRVEHGTELTEEGVAEYRKALGLDDPPARPGIYPGLSFSDYHRIDAAHHSMLEGFSRTPAHAREAMLRPAESSVAQALGHAFHVCLLEPERFDLEYVVPPKFDRRTKVGKSGWKDWELNHPHALLIDQDEADLFRRMRDSVLSHTTARELLTGPGAAEFSIIWTDETTGLLCKGRIDRVGQLGGYSFIVDVKTTRNAAERAFSKDVASYGYHRQLAFYREGLTTLRPGPSRRCAIIAVEKDPPYCSAVHELDERALEQGWRESLAHLESLKRCKETGIWPGYDDGLGLMDLPPWAVDRLD